MIPIARPCRSALYVPASRARAMDKARALPADAVIFDLEDAVAPEEKDAARRLLRDVLAGRGFGPRLCLARVNAAGTPWGAADLDALAAARPEAILLPKVRGPGCIAALAARLDARPETAGTAIWAMIETPRAILDIAAIAAAPRMAGMVMGTNDLAKDLGARSRGAMTTALHLCVLAARAHGLLCLDGVYNAFRDAAGLARECAEGRDMGFDGKTLIHPDQIAAANAAFAPTEDDIDLARRQIAAYDAATARGEGVAVLDGRIVENLHVETARATLARAQAIAELDAA